MAKTKNGIVYPDNYDKVADVPADLKGLAESVDEVIENNKTEMKKSNKTRDEKISKNVEDIGIIQETIKSEKESIDKSLENINTKDEKQDEDIKANKESIEELQAENLEIKSENERLRNDIKSIALPGEASGESIHLEDSSDARCELEIGGNHVQETREGYNQFKITSTQTQGAGITITKIDESSVSYQGTTTGSFTHILVEYGGNGLEITEQMYLKAFGNLTNAIFSVKIIRSGETETRYLTISPDLILNVGDVLQQVYVQQRTTGILVSGTLQVLLTDYENKDKSYEQYGASPSIDYPSTVKVVGDNVNLFPGWEMGTIDVATGNKITDPYYIRSVDFIPILPNIDYTIYSINSFGFDSLNTALRLYDKDKKYLGNQYLGEILEKNLTFKITNLDARFMIPTSTNGQKNKIPGNAKVDIKLEKGTKATPYSLYETGSVEIDVVNKNFINMPKKSTTWNGAKVICQDNKITFKGNSDGTLGLNFSSYESKIKMSKGNKITYSSKYVSGSYTAGNSYYNLKLIYQDGTFTTINMNRSISTYKNDISNTITLEKDVVAYQINGAGYAMSGLTNELVYEFQLEIGDTASDIVEQSSQTAIMPIQQEMLTDDYISDKEHHTWGKMILTGEENIGTDSVFQGITQFSLFVKSSQYVYDNIIRALSNYFKGVGFVDSWKIDNSIVTSANGKIRFMTSQYATVDEFKSYIKAKYDEGNPVIVYYKLETPIELDFTDRQKLIAKKIKSEAHTYKNITNISAESAEVNPIINVKYLKDTETEHNKLQAQIDEIKELLSTTETSSLLLDNIQKDLESEV